MSTHVRPHLDDRPGRREVVCLGWEQDGVVSRRQALAAGMTRWQIKAELRAQRWRAHGRQTLAIHTGTLVGLAPFWYATFEAGPRAAIDGASSLEVAGLKGFELGHIRVSVPQGSPAVRRPGLVVRQTRRLRSTDVVGTGLPRVRTDIAAVRGALWAVSDRQAATLLAMTVQQRVAGPDLIGKALLDIRRDKRRRFITTVVLDLLDGAQAMGELDFAAMARVRGLPPPARQVLRRGRGGRIYLDVYWPEFALVVEIDGIHHLHAQSIVGDALRQNELSLEGDTVIRLPLLGLRVSTDEFFAQIEVALVRGGWRRTPA